MRRLAAPEMFWELTGNALGSPFGLGLRLARTWNARVSHYDGSETGQGVRNVQQEKTL